VREKKGLTQSDPAEKVGVGRVTITRIETGARNLSMPLALKLAKAFKVKVGELLE